MRSIKGNEILTMNKNTKPLLNEYLKAFESIQSDHNTQLIVAKHNDELLGVAQINFLTYLTYTGGTRAQIEGVRVHQDYRDQNIGSQLFEYLITLAKQRHCHLVQLTTDKSRPDAYRFYEKLGFINSHEGFKLHL